MKRTIPIILLLLIASTSICLSQEKVNLRKLHRHAKKGYTYANYKLGKIYDDGILVEKDVDKAAECYEIAAESNYLESVDWILDYYSRRNNNPKMLFLWTKKASEYGDSVATFDLSKMFEYGIGCKPNPNLRFFYCKKAAENGYLIAQKDLSEMYFRGFIVDPSFAKGVQWLDSAANNGDKHSQLLLAEIYYRGEDVMQDISKAIEFYTLAAEKENPIAQVCLLHHYSGKSGYKENIELYNYWHQRFLLNPDFNNSMYIEDNIKEYTKLAFEKNYTAVLLPYWTSIKNESDNKELIDQVLRKMLNQTEKDLGSIYFKLAIADYCYANIGEYTNQKLILNYCKDAAKTNIPEAKTLLEEMYKSKYASGFFKYLSTYYEDAIKNGQNWAADSLVIHYAFNPGASRSYDFFKKHQHHCSPETYYFVSSKHHEGLYSFDSIEALNYCKYAYKNGVTEAELLLAIYYYEGKLVEKNCKLAFEIFNKPEMKELPEATYYLGLCFLNGCGVATDIEKANKKLRIAADNGCPDAQLLYAEQIYKGLVKDQPIENCLDYYFLSAENGNNEASNQIGKFYYYGQFVDKNDELALNYINGKNDVSGELHYLIAKIICEMDGDMGYKDSNGASNACKYAIIQGYPKAKNLWNKYNLEQWESAMSRFNINDY